MRVLGPLILALLCAGSLSCAGTRQTRDEVTPSGFLTNSSKLKPGGEDRAQLLYIKPGLSLASYRAIVLEPVKLYAGAEDSNLAKLSREDQQMLADRLHTSLVTALSKDWTITEQSGAGVLVVRGALTEASASNVPLDVVATLIPQVRLLSMVGGLGADTALTVGSVRGEAEVLDGSTNEQLLAAVDTRVGTRGVEGVTDKWSDVQMAFDDWAERMRLRLAELRGGK